MALSIDAILGASDLAAETVAVPEWGGEVLLKEMDGETRIDYEQALRTHKLIDEEGKVNLDQFARHWHALVVAYTMVDEQGNRIAIGQHAALAKKSAKVLTRLFAVADRLNGLSAGAHEAAEKN